MIKCKSIYAPPSVDDGERIFVDRLWPEGISTRDAAIQSWLQEVAPSYELWRFQFSPENWQNYRRLYWQELSDQALRPRLTELKERSQNNTLTLLYGTNHVDCNNAVALKEYLEKFNNLS